MSWLDKLAKYISDYLEKRRKKKEKPEPVKVPVDPEVKPNTPAGTDALPWESINWHGQNKADKALPTKVLRSAKVRGDMHVALDYDTNADWAPCKVIEGCQASFMCFTTAIDGALRGGHVDHLKTNCFIRDLGNFYNGYILSGVPRNQDLYIAIASHDGKFRSNMVKAIRE